jgi:ubiquinone/menaquinone biosynthesis C-methylase UbiE
LHEGCLISHKGHIYSASGAWFLDNPIRRWLQPPGELIEKLGVTSEQMVMDFGCGPGYYIIELAKRAKKLVAVDIQTQMLKKAQRKAAKANAQNIRFLQSNGTSIKLEDGSVDMVFLVTVFHEISDSATVLKEFNRILKPAGKLVIVEVIKKGIFPGAPVQNPQTIQAEVIAANFKLQQMQPYKGYGVFFFGKKA